MTDEPDTTPLDEDVTDNVALSDDDTPDSPHYYDPDADQDTVEVESEDGTDDEADEAEADEPAEGQETEEQPDEDPDTVTVTLDDGAAVPLGELKKGYLRQADFTRKTQELSNERNSVSQDRDSLKADNERLQRVTQSFVEHLTSLVPDAPDASLALSNPNSYTAKKAQHEAAMAQVQKLIEVGSEATGLGSEINAADKLKADRAANAKLVEMFPQAASGESRKTFFKDVASVATELGFSNEELGGLVDPRIFALAHYAKIGREAETAKVTAKAKVAKAPPATPRKPGRGARQASGNAEAMRKLTKSGSIHDAIQIDFD